MKKLVTKDLFAALRLVKQCGLREEIKPIMEKAASGEFSVSDIGIEGILTLIEAFSTENAEKSLYEFLAGPFEMTAEEIKTLDINALAKNLSDLVRENDLKSFFGLLFRLDMKN